MGLGWPRWGWRRVLRPEMSFAGWSRSITDSVVETEEGRRGGVMEGCWGWGRMAGMGKGLWEGDQEV